MRTDGIVIGTHSFKSIETLDGVERMRPSVVYWNNIPAPYMVERFNALADRGDLEFEAWFNDRVKSHRSWDVDETQWRFRYRYLPIIKIGRWSFHSPFILIRRRPEVLVSLYAEPSFLFGWLLAKLLNVRTVFWVEVTFDRWVSRSRLKERFKRWLLPKADAILTVGHDGKKFAQKYSVPDKNIFFARHAVDVNHYQRIASNFRYEREEFRRRLNIEGVAFIYVGRLWWGKGLINLLNAFEMVQREAKEEVSLLCVGDGPEECKLKEICASRGIDNVVFTGFKQKAELPRYYAIADVFVFPTLGDPYGMVVDEAMACSLPIISTSAAGEILDRVEEGVNGYIVPPEDDVMLADRMLHLVRYAQLRADMGQASWRKIKDNVPERWAENFGHMISTLVVK